ncbi:MAG: efflux RND transporter permease subunit [Pseudobdellovibrionaceae bacterium]
MSLSDISIKKPVFAWMIMASILIFGGISFMRLGVSQLPDVDFPVVSISLSLSGAAPEVIESQVIDVIEDAVMGIEGIKNITSKSQQSSGNISIEFDVDKDINIAVQEVQTRISQVQNLLPVNLDPPTIRKTNPEDQPIMWIVLTSDGKMTLAEQMSYIRNTLFDQFSTVDGVGDVSLGGYVDPNLRVWVSAPKLLKNELTVTDVINSIKSNHQEVPAGRIENNNKEYNVRLMGEANDPIQFGKIPITYLGGKVNYKSPPLTTVVQVEEGLNEIRRISRFGNMRAIGLGIMKQHGSNALDVVNSVRKKVATIEKNLPAGLHISIPVDQTKFIKDSIDELNFTLILSALLTSLVCYLFLGSWSSTFNVLLAIPTSIVGAFMVIHFFNFTLNTFTLLGLSLAIGIVVDDAIMMLENIMRHMDKGQGRVEASVKGANEITFAALAATVAVVAIFMPVVFMKGIIGRYFYQFGITVTAAVLLSLLEALTLTPMRCSRFLSESEKKSRVAELMDPLLDKISNIYHRILVWSLDHRVTVLVSAVGIFIASIFIIKQVPGELLPPQDQSKFLLRIKAPVGSSIDFTNEKSKEVENILSTRKEVSSFYATVGGFGGDDVNQSMMIVLLVPPEDRKQSQTEVMNSLREEIKQKVKKVQVIAQDLSLRGFSASRGFPVEFTVQGPDWSTLGEVTTKMMEAVKETGLVTDVNTDYQINMPEVQLVPDRDKAAAHGVSINDISNTVNSLVGGVTMGSQTRYLKDGHRYDIRLRLLPDERNEAQDISKIMVRNNRKELVSLSQLTSLKELPALQVISRQNRERSITVFGNVAPGHSQQEAITSVQKLGAKILPSGYHAEISGSSQSYKESMRSLLFAFILGIIVSYMVLSSQFNSFLDPVTVLMALPFSISGAFIGLYLTHQSINMFSMIGLILLMGIVKKNSILLVEFTNHLRSEGLSVQDAILQACPIRLRPILMTSVATVVGAIPAAMKIGPGAETRVPMAVAIIGGVIVSTILTLIVVPCFYSLTTKNKKPASEPQTGGTLP